MPGKADTLLKDYRAKRDFAKTREPSGETLGGTAGTFVVQMHDATRLHWDFRLELDGVLKSWAVTRGPSLDPKDKRLAVRVEDHPLDYGTFEGTIPEGEYGGGIVMLWDEGTWEPLGDPHEGLEAGDLKFRLHGHRMKGEWVLVHMKGRDKGKRENWLLIKHRDEFARDGEDLATAYKTSVSTGRDLQGIAAGNKPKKPETTKVEAERPAVKQARAKTASRGKSIAMPAFQPPQLATLVSEVPEGSDWLFEMKYDGYRSLAAIAGEEVRLYTRTGKDWTRQFARLREPLSRLTKGTALIDGEICAFNGDGRTDFSTLKDALGDGGALVYFAFDLLERDGEDLTRLPLIERKAMLQKLIGKIEKDSPIQFSDHVTGNGQKVFDAMCRGGFEGIIAKRASAPYSNERSRTWLKIKCAHRQEFVIGGWSPSTRKSTFASLLIGTWENGKLVYRGRVGTGFNNDDARALQQALDKRARDTSPFDDAPRLIARRANWVEPELVAEVGYAEFTPDGYLRHPSFLGLREDKPARNVVMEEPVEGHPEMASTKGKTALADDAGTAMAEKVGVHLTSPDRVLYPGQGITKAEIVAYYAAVADRMLPYIADRPLSLLRCPQGRAKYCFFQKHDTGGFPDAMKSIPITEETGQTENYFYIDDLAGLIAGTQMNVLEWHLWGSKRDNIEKPERIIFDIDPDEGRTWADVREAAADIRDALKAIGLQTFPLVSGGKGVHVIAPLVPDAGWDDVKAFSKAIATALAEAQPDRFVATMSKAKRKGKMFIDYLRNERGSTAIAPYSARSREGAPVATPVTWEELESVKAANAFPLKEVAARAAGPDPWQGYFETEQSITKAMLQGLGVLKSPAS
jgi:bifunctional non-homologous end joining protein LigD